MTAKSHFLVLCIFAITSTLFLLIFSLSYIPLFLGPVLAQQWVQLSVSLRAKLGEFKYQKAKEDIRADPKENCFSQATIVHLLV